MTRHLIRPTQSANTTKPETGLGWWVGAIAFFLPLIAILATCWIGANAIITQARSNAEASVRAEADFLALSVGRKVQELLTGLHSAALNGWDDSSTNLDQTWFEQSYLVTPEEMPANPSRAKAVRLARASGAAVLVDVNAPAMLVLAATDHPDRPSRIAMAEITPQSLLNNVPRRAPLGETVLLDRNRSTFQEGVNPDDWNHEGSNASSDSASMIRVIRPVHDYPLYVGVARAKPGDWTLLVQNGRSLLIAGGLCIVLVSGSFLVLAVMVRRRLLEADAKRSLAFQEMEHVQKLSSIGRLAAGVAHEINNPLAIIAEKAGLMKDLAAAAQDMPKAQRFIALNDSILQAVTRCRAVTHRLLGFARRMEVRPMELDLNDVLRETLGFLERDALFRGVTLEQQLDENLPGIESDRGQLQQVFLNLLNNAMAAVSDNGRIRVATRREAGGVVVEIEDNGVGMSRETLSHIFEPFFSTKGEQGTGLGLSITYGIVDKLGGSIEVASAEGEGTLFTIHLPLRSNIEAPSSAGVLRA